MRPYYERGGITIYHGDCREFLESIGPVDVVLTDPPYGIDGARGGGNRQRGKGKYHATGWQDTPEYLREVCVPVITHCVEVSDRMGLTPGTRHQFFYPAPDDVGCFWMPAAIGVGPWGFVNYQPIFFYGTDPRKAVGRWPAGRQLTEPSNVPDHPCAKPIQAWTWLLSKLSHRADDVVLDPFVGSGTTLRAAKNLARRAIGIEIEERYCEVAATRLSQETLWGVENTEKIAGKGEVIPFEMPSGGVI